MQSIYKSNQMSLIHTYARKKNILQYILQIRKLLFGYVIYTYLDTWIYAMLFHSSHFCLYCLHIPWVLSFRSLVFSACISAVGSQPHPNDMSPSLRCLRRPRNASCDDAASVEFEHPKSATWKRWFGGSFRWFAAENGPPRLLMERKTIFLPLGSWDKVAKGFNEGASRKCKTPN